MIVTLLRSGWINLRRDRVAQALTFLLPIIFFSIFASVFGNQRNLTSKIRIALVDEDQSDYSKKIGAALVAEGGLDVRTTRKAADGSSVLLDRGAAEALVKAGTVPVAVVLPKGIGAAPRFFTGGASTGPKVQLLADVSDPVAPQVVQGLLQKVSFTAAPESMAIEGMSMFEKYAGPMTPTQQQSRDRFLSGLRNTGGTSLGPPAQGGPIGLPMELVNVMQPKAQGNGSLISFYAAGVGVMFLLFSSSGAGGSLLDEEESGTLGRLIGSRAGMTGVLAGKWLFLTLTGIAQLTVMFTWGQLIFKLPLTSHIPGFLVMTIFTAAAAAAFGLVLATISRSRQQLSGISTILILTMSALGGSMFPRFLMTPAMQKIGLVTFNAWALDGYIAVFWREAPVSALWLQLLVLSGLTAVFLASARVLARRWETL
jgi:ABC-2 type transport system permease protein